MSKYDVNQNLGSIPFLKFSFFLSFFSGRVNSFKIDLLFEPIKSPYIEI